MEKVKELLKEQDVYVIEKLKDKKGDVHILAQQINGMGMYVVWSSFYTGEEETSYENLYSGHYTHDIKDAVSVLIGRVEK